MNKVNIDKVKQITGMVLGEQGRTLYVTPIIAAISLIFVLAFIENNHVVVIEDVMKFGLPMSMFIPTLLIIQKFVSDSQVQRIITIPASNLDKYTAMLVAIVIQSVLWFVIMLVTDVVLLSVACSVLYGIETSSVLAVIIDTKFLLQIIPMMFMAALVGWGKIAARTALSRRVVDYVLIALSFVVYLILIMLVIFINQNVIAVVVSLTIYSFVVMILAIIRSYYNFKKIISYVNK